LEHLLKAYPSRKLSRGFSVLTLSTLLGASCALAEESVVSEKKTSLVFEPITVTGEKLERELKNTAKFLQSNHLVTCYLVLV